jgi:hypothetical protein
VLCISPVVPRVIPSLLLSTINITFIDGGSFFPVAVFAMRIFDLMSPALAAELPPFHAILIRLFMRSTFSRLSLAVFFIFLSIWHFGVPWVFSHKKKV